MAFYGIAIMPHKKFENLRQKDAVPADSGDIRNEVSERFHRWVEKLWQLRAGARKPLTPEAVADLSSESLVAIALMDMDVRRKCRVGSESVFLLPGESLSGLDGQGAEPVARSKLLTCERSALRPPGSESSHLSAHGCAVESSGVSMEPRETRLQRYEKPQKQAILRYRSHHWKTQKEFTWQSLTLSFRIPCHQSRTRICVRILKGLSGT
jgi:hypothetical protein